MAGRPPIALDKRFWEKVLRRGPDECWLWQGAEHGKGYGGILIDYKSVPAHRVSYALCHGVVPAGTFVLHRCDTPKCVNPGHLFLGSHQDNMDDMVAKGRARNGKVSFLDRWKMRDKNNDPTGIHIVWVGGRRYFVDFSASPPTVHVQVRVVADKTFQRAIKIGSLRWSQAIRTIQGEMARVSV